jgi:hypothetical protein
MILSCILLRKMDRVMVSGFAALIGLGMPCWALAKDPKAEREAMLTGTTMRAINRNIQEPSNMPWARIIPTVLTFKLAVFADT